MPCFTFSVPADAAHLLECGSLLNTRWITKVGDQFGKVPFNGLTESGGINNDRLNLLIMLCYVQFTFIQSLEENVIAKHTIMEETASSIPI